ncbi:LysR substrate-binding domain-containing protein [Paraburkholderia sp.]|uniref:LysR substrate-binding domain-containing protein n=1 Tax=Paraburkholderia sp. TaxID=1926495 RepID=UPI0023924375|nr:LysR substrate-binding domain-containing protein [Paraburkholderia sp.]MDE1179356.1 LysR substrate-binding domain-containing protein [Paraburkholderia sp.]
MLRFRQIEAFRCVMTTGTSVSAAQKMHVTQPAISRLVADLEAYVGFRLFNRVKGRLEPTEAGRRFYLSVEENFLGLERLKQVADSIRSEVSEGLTVACLPVIASTLLPPVLSAFYAETDDITVQVESVKVPDVLSKLQNHTVDVALSIAFAAAPGIEVEPLISMPALCAMPADHPLATRSVVHPQDLENERMIGWMPNSHHTYELELALFKSNTSRPRYTVVTDTAHTRYAMVAHGLGLSVVEPFASKVWRAHNIVVRPFESPVRYDYVIAYPRTSLRSDVVASFRKSALKVIAEYDFGIET